MRKPRRAVLEAVEAWLEHAEEDLDLARRALQAPPRVKGACGHAHLEDLRLMNRFAPPLRYPDKPAPPAGDALAAVRLAERLVQEIRALMRL